MQVHVHECEGISMFVYMRTCVYLCDCVYITCCLYHETTSLQIYMLGCSSASSPQ